MCTARLDQPVEERADDRSSIERSGDTTHLQTKVRIKLTPECPNLSTPSIDSVDWKAASLGIQLWDGILGVLMEVCGTVRDGLSAAR
jgi:hypothetical protein